MAKLYFRYGTVGSAKTMNLLAVAHNYRAQNKTAYLLKPKLDNRFGEDVIKSRSGLEMDADFLIAVDEKLDVSRFEGAHCLLIDEAQFLSGSVIEQLKEVSNDSDIPVICYGLRTDFRTQLFPGSKRLLELSDSIEEVKTTCSFCNKKAIFNLKFKDGIPTVEGPVVDLGAEEKYLPVCSYCYTLQLKRDTGRELAGHHLTH
jgi:thymidine kinase